MHKKAAEDVGRRTFEKTHSGGSTNDISAAKTEDIIDGQRFGSKNSHLSATFNNVSVNNISQLFVIVKCFLKLFYKNLKNYITVHIGGSWARHY